MHALEAGTRSVGPPCIRALLRTLQAVSWERPADARLPIIGSVTATRSLSQLAVAPAADDHEGHAPVRSVQDYNTFVSMLARRRRFDARMLLRHVL